MALPASVAAPAPVRARRPARAGPQPVVTRGAVKTMGRRARCRRLGGAYIDVVQTFADAFVRALTESATLEAARAQLKTLNAAAVQRALKHAGRPQLASD
jgi:histone H3/H4